MIIFVLKKGDSIIHIQIFHFFRFFSYIVYYRVLSRILCVVQQQLKAILRLVRDGEMKRQNLEILKPQNLEKLRTDKK